MKVDIKNVEKTKGMLRKTTYYGVQLTVLFTEEEKAVIKNRNLGNLVILERGQSADQKPEPRLVEMGIFNLTPSTLLDGPNLHWFETLGQTKQYIDNLKEALTELKDVIDANKETAEDQSFEL